ncbi:MAG: serine hydroxymethyltransferase [Deltaproteobacteria bacterium]|nr:serine hydroxymethyltransferase [Deltaproteobacteria bacterium]
MLSKESLAVVDPEIHAAIEQELNRQRRKLVLIASENYISPAMLAAGAGIMTNKYAEGYPGKRYYGGCQFVDLAETLAVDRAKQLFQADYANVQPHSGSQANMAVYFSVLQPGDTILGMRLSHGGHLTHGSPVSFSGRLYNIVSYGVDRDTGVIDMEEVRRLAREHRPKLIITGASAYPRFFDFQTFGDIAAEVGAYFMVDMAHVAGLIAAGVHPSPISIADFVTSTTHKTLRGPRGGLVLAKASLGNKIAASIFPGIQGGPLMHLIAAKAVAFKEAMEPGFIEYSRQVLDNAARLAGNLTAAGFDLVSGGTDNHLMLIDLRSKNLTGRIAERTLDQAGIITNKNSVPFDPQPPKVTSGLRLGTPAVTTRGLGVAEMDLIAEYIATALARPEDERLLAAINDKVQLLCERFPLYPGMAI